MDCQNKSKQTSVQTNITFPKVPDMDIWKRGYENRANLCFSLKSPAPNPFLIQGFFSASCFDAFKNQTWISLSLICQCPVE